MKCKIRAEPEKNCIKTKKNPFTKSGKEKLRELGIESVNHYLAVLDTLEERIEMLEDEFEKIAENDERAKLLMTIPGISHFSAVLIFSEIGNIDRFLNPEKLYFYAGLVPTVHQSRETMGMGNIKKESSGFLRWILVECVGGSFPRGRLKQAPNNAGDAFRDACAHTEKLVINGGSMFFQAKP